MSEEITEQSISDILEINSDDNDTTEIISNSAYSCLFINPYIPMSKFYGVRYQKFGAVMPPLGMAYITGYLKKNGYHAKLIDANAYRIDNQSICDYIKRKKYNFIGLYATTLGYKEAKELAFEIRQTCPDVKLILGGPHAIGEKEKVFEDTDLFDFVCGGEGELCVKKLLDCLNEDKREFHEVDALAWKDYNGNVRYNPPKEVIDLATVPSPAEEIGDYKLYHQKVFAYRHRPFATILTTRGCPFKCVFCSSPGYLQDIQGGKLRRHNIDWIDRELDYLVNKQGVKEVYFVDDTFNLGMPIVKKLCNLIIEKYPDLTWSCNFEVNIASKEMLQLMQKAGCWSIMIGAESGNQEILDTIRKGIKVEQIRKVSKWCYEIGLMGRASFILGHPKETKESINETISLAKEITFPFITFSLMTPLPGTELFGMADDYGNWKYDTEDCSLSKASFAPFGLTTEYLEEMQVQAHKEVYLNFGKNFRLLRYLLKPQNRDFAYQIFYRVAKTLISNGFGYLADVLPWKRNHTRKTNLEYKHLLSD